MGGGSWTTSSFDAYTCGTKGMSAANFAASDSVRTQDIFKTHRIDEMLNPKGIMRECRDSAEHPNTLPVILGLDVTGSMGAAATKVAQKLGEIMTDLYSDADVPDIEFCVMGIGDVYCDEAPIQMSQFESDIRIAEQLDKIYFEGGGGGNSYESYTAAWYMGLRHCDLDCWNRDKKGIIITLGDELPNPYLPKNGYYNTFASVTGDKIQGDIETRMLYPEVIEKFNVYHISVDDKDSCYSWHNHSGDLDKEWKKLLGDDHYFVATLNNLAKTIVDIIKSNIDTSASRITSTEEVSW